MSLVFDHVTLINLCISNYREATGAMFIHAKSVKSVKAACVCILFFFRYFKYYGKNISKNNHVLFNS